MDCWGLIMPKRLTNDSWHTPILFWLFLGLSKNRLNIDISTYFLYRNGSNNTRKSWGHILKILFFHISTSQKSNFSKCLEAIGHHKIETYCCYHYFILFLKPGGSKTICIFERFQNITLRWWNLDIFWKTEHLNISKCY